ncbi:MAG: hypothetical protein AAF799_24525 [Myxococcota bacterium]
MHPRVIVAVLVAIVGGSCSTPDPRDRDRKRTPVAQATPPTSTAPSTAEPDDASSVVGWDSIPARPRAEASRANRQALAHHRAGRYAEALAGFDRALQLQPDHAWARYNRACARARLGNGEPVVSELEILLRSDLPTFLPRWHDDEDLAAIRESEAGRRLAARLPQIQAAYADAIARGILAMTYRPRPLRDEDHQLRAPHRDLRLGVFDPQTRRFVPITPRVRGALGGLVDREAGRVLVLAGDLKMQDMWVVQARRLDVDVFPLDASGRPLVHARNVDVRPQTDELRSAVRAALEGDGARVTLDELMYNPADTRSLAVDADGVRVEAKPIDPDRAHIVVDRGGMWVDRPPPAGVSITGRTLRVAGQRESWKLGEGHEFGHTTVERSPDGRWLMILTDDVGCGDGEGFAEHVLDRLDLDRGELTRLSQAPAHAGAGLGPDGSVYFDTEGVVLRYPPGTSKPVADVPEAIRWATPDYEPDCSI